VVLLKVRFSGSRVNASYKLINEALDKMQETIDQLKYLFRNFWEYKWLALATAALLSILGWAAVVIAPDKYEVSTRVYVDTRSMLKPILKGMTVESAVTESAAENMKGILLARPNLEIIARKTGLDTGIESSAAYEKMIMALTEKVMISGGREYNNVYTIMYTNRDPIMAKNVVQSLLDMFVERVIGANRLDTDVTKKFLDEKISEYEIRLSGAEERLKEFKKENPGVLINDDRTYFTRLEAMRTQLQTARLDLQEQEHRRIALSKQLKTTPSHSRSGGGIISGGGAVTQNPIDLSIMEAQAQISGLMLKYSNSHPDVVSAKRKLQQLQVQKSAGVTGAVAGADNSVLRSAPISIANPAYQTLKLAYGEADAMVAALNTRVEEYTKRLVEMEADADTLPDIEARLARLDRDYEVNKREYEELLKRREFAVLTEGANNADELQFEVIDPPRVPLTPAGPNRLKWITMVLLVGLGGGVGLSMFLSMLRPKIYNKKSVKQITTLPILGSVSQLNSVGNHLAKGAGNISYALASGALFVAYGVLAGLYLFNSDLVRDYAGFGAEQVQEQLEGGLISPIKTALEEI